MLPNTTSMNPKLSALKKKIGGVVSKVVNKGGDFIANRVMTGPTADRMRGATADMKRDQIVVKRQRQADGY